MTMSTGPVIKLDVAPTLYFPSPRCMTCQVDVSHDGDAWVCPKCGTAWAPDATDDRGDLYEDWSGETLDLPVTPADEAWAVPLPATRGRRR